MLQNRVDPEGAIIKTKARGCWLGNRGVLHNERKEIIRLFKLKAWITCQLEFKGRHREIMQPGRWTELLFPDEATAFSAGHRPCFQCRYHDHQRFKSYWLKGNPEYGFDAQTPVAKIDEVIHRQRIKPDQSKLTYREQLSVLPGGTFILHRDKPYLLCNGRLYLWHADSYEAAITLPGSLEVSVLTPVSFVNMFRAGYIPQMAI